MEQIEMRSCLSCFEPLTGRIDKIYCDEHCKSSYQYKQIKEDKASLHFKINRQLRRNKKILKDHNKAGKATVRASELHKLGFNPRIFTHYWKAKNGNTYLFVFEYGWQEIKDNNKNKYSIIKWQPYMSKQIGKLSRK